MSLWQTLSRKTRIDVNLFWFMDVVFYLLLTLGAFVAVPSHGISETLLMAQDDEIAFDEELTANLSGVVSSSSGELKLVAKTKHGLLAKLDGVRDVLILEGTPEEMGAAHGELMKEGVLAMKERLFAAGRAASIKEKTDFFGKIDEAIRRSRPYTPKRFYDEINALASSVSLEAIDTLRLNNFPELFHCSGVGLRGKATKDGRVLHVRVLDYMRDIGLQDNSAIVVYRPKGFYSWISVSYTGFVGTVTAMNEKGLTIGEMGGAGEGKWDGLPMAFMMRRVMEECSTVDEAVALMKSVPLTCDYYYVLSDASGDLVAIEAVAESESPIRTLLPGEENTRLPGSLDDVVYVSSGERAQKLYERLHENYGSIDVELLQEIIKRPVSMKSNLHDAIFAPETLELWHAEAGVSTPACDEPYVHVDFHEIIDFYEREQENN